MANCAHCGSELHGQYCDLCGAKAAEPLSTHAVRLTTVRTGALPPVQRSATRGQAGPWLMAALLGAAFFGGGLVIGWGMASSIAQPTVVAAPAEPEQAPLSPRAQAEALVREGIDDLQNGDQAAALARFQEAARQYEAAVQAEPDDLFLRTYLGLTYFYTGDPVKARTTELEVLDRDPGYLWALFNLAWIQENSGKTSEALLLYEEYLDVAPAERENVLKYAEQPELIETQIAAAKEALANLQGGGGQ